MLHIPGDGPHRHSPETVRRRDRFARGGLLTLLRTASPLPPGSRPPLNSSYIPGRAAPSISPGRAARPPLPGHLPRAGIGVKRPVLFPTRFAPNSSGRAVWPPLPGHLPRTGIGVKRPILFLTRCALNIWQSCAASAPRPFDACRDRCQETHTFPNPLCPPISRQAQSRRGYPTPAAGHPHRPYHRERSPAILRSPLASLHIPPATVVLRLPGFQPSPPQGLLRLTPCSLEPGLAPPDRHATVILCSPGSRPARQTPQPKSLLFFRTKNVPLPQRTQAMVSASNRRPIGMC